jgi:hypothetical protein
MAFGHLKDISVSILMLNRRSSGAVLQRGQRNKLPKDDRGDPAIVALEGKNDV